MKLPISPDQLKRLLVEQNLIAPERFDELYQEAERKSQSVIDILVSEKIVERAYLDDLIAGLLGVPRADFSVVKIDKDTVNLLAEASPASGRSSSSIRKRTERTTSRWWTRRTSRRANFWSSV